MKFRKLPVLIEAHQWDGSRGDAERIKALFPSMVQSSMSGYQEPDSQVSWSIKTLEGHHTVSAGDWIIRGVAGEFYPCKQEIFAETYEAAT